MKQFFLIFVASLTLAACAHKHEGAEHKHGEHKHGAHGCGDCSSEQKAKAEHGKKEKCSACAGDSEKAAE